MKYTREYSSWNAMLNRCHNPRAKDYPRYGAKGIVVCAQWRASFITFYEHLGPRPAGTTLDRIEGSKGYEPGNVRWATPKQQAQNRKTAKVWVIDGLRFDSADAAANHFGVTDATVHRWAKGGFDARRGTIISKKEGCYIGTQNN